MVNRIGNVHFPGGWQAQTYPHKGLGLRFLDLTFAGTPRACEFPAANGQPASGDLGRAGDGNLN